MGNAARSRVRAETPDPRTERVACLAPLPIETAVSTSRVRSRLTIGAFHAKAFDFDQRSAPGNDRGRLTKVKPRRKGGGLGGAWVYQTSSSAGSGRSRVSWPVPRWAALIQINLETRNRVLPPAASARNTLDLRDGRQARPEEDRRIGLRLLASRFSESVLATAILSLLSRGVSRLASE